jgi:hypothetical protein
MTICPLTSAATAPAVAGVETIKAPSRRQQTTCRPECEHACVGDIVHLEGPLDVAAQGSMPDFAVAAASVTC